MARSSVRLQADPAARPDQSMQPWQFFVLAALACATAVTFIVRGQGVTAVVLLAVLMGSAALVALAALRTVRPLLGAYQDRTSMIGQRTRTALEREKMLSLRAIKELEFDKAMGKVSDEDFREMSARLRARASRLMRQLDAGAGYREQVERDLAKRLGGGKPAEADVRRAGAETDVRRAGPMDPPEADVDQPDAKVCASCSTTNDIDARFCKECGGKL